MKSVLGAVWGVGILGVLPVVSTDDVVGLVLPCPYPDYGTVSFHNKEADGKPSARRRAAHTQGWVQ